MQIQSILIINSKGGSGKTTLATNLASYYANKRYKTAIMDYDPQGSSTHWLKIRPYTPNPIHGAGVAKGKYELLRSWQMHIPDHIEKVIIDAPAGAGTNGFLLQEMCHRADQIVIPVPPSSIDVHATADFIKELMLMGKVRQRKIELAVVANRVRLHMPLYKPLERFLKSLSIPFITQLTDSDVYVHVAEKGLGIYDLNSANVKIAKAEFKPLIDWLVNPVNRDSTVYSDSRYSWKPSNVINSSKPIATAFKIT